MSTNDRTNSFMHFTHASKARDEMVEALFKGVEQCGGDLASAARAVRMRPTTVRKMLDEYLSELQPPPSEHPWSPQDDTNDDHNEAWNDD